LAQEAGVEIAITGSHGLIGSALIPSLTADGHQVRRIVRSSGRGDDIGWDIEGGTMDAAGLEGIDAVVHLAGEGIGDKRWTAAYKRRVLESRTRSTTLLAETLAGLSAPPAVVVSGSAVGYYGDRADEVLTEASAPGTIFLSQVCTAWEAATAAAEQAGIRVAHIRTGPVLAANGGLLTPIGRLFRFGLGGRLGDGRQWLAWISLADEVGAIRFLIDHEVAGPVNLTAPAPVTNREFTAVLGRVLHRPTFMAVPKVAPRLLLGRERADQLLFVSQRALPTILEREGFEFQHPELEPTLRALLT